MKIILGSGNHAVLYEYRIPVIIGMSTHKLGTELQRDSAEVAN